jgi:hypothetical protein
MGEAAGGAPALEDTLAQLVGEAESGPVPTDPLGMDAGLVGLISAAPGA